MEVDTGASLSVISEAAYREVWGHNASPLEPAPIKLTTYTGECIPIQGARDVEVEHNGVRERIVTKGEGPSLLGRNWLERLRIDWKGVYMLQARASLGSILDIFKDELGTITYAKASLRIDTQAVPQFHPPPPPPPPPRVATQS